MRVADLVLGRIYRLDSGEFAEFSRIGATGLAVFHPLGEPDMQSSFVVNPWVVDREATKEEVAWYRG